MDKEEEIGIFEAKTHLSSIIDKVEKGKRFIITKRGKRIAELRPIGEKRKEPRFGSAKNDKYWMADDFNEPLRDFEEYME